MNSELQDVLAEAGVNDSIIALFAENSAVEEGPLSGLEKEALVENPSRGTVTTFKLRNLTWLSWGKIATALTGGGVKAYAGDPVGAFLAGLGALWALIGDIGFELGEGEAQLALVLWRDKRGCVPVDEARATLKPVDELSFQEAISKLLAAGVIDLEDGVTIIKRDRILLSIG